MCDGLPTGGSEHVSRCWVAHCNLAPRVDLRDGTYQNSAGRMAPAQTHMLQAFKLWVCIQIQKCRSKHNIEIFVIAKNQHIAYIQLQAYIQSNTYCLHTWQKTTCSFHQSMFHSPTRCAAQAPGLAGIWVEERKTWGQQTFSPSFSLNCSHRLSAPVCFPGLAWPPLQLLAARQHVQFGRAQPLPPC